MKLTENQEMYLNLFNEFVQQEVAPRIKELDEVDEYPIWMRDRMAELGFTRLVAPEEYGGFGESMTTLGSCSSSRPPSTTTTLPPSSTAPTTPTSC